MPLHSFVTDGDMGCADRIGITDPINNLLPSNHRIPLSILLRNWVPLVATTLRRVQTGTQPAVDGREKLAGRLESP
jgi:hypothetical protein